MRFIILVFYILNIQNILCLQIKKIHVTQTEAKNIGEKIWQNECGGKAEYLTHWIKGEPCASMGIGHFIWYPKNIHGPYTQTFPQLLAYFKKHHVKLPDWLSTNKNYCPWNSEKDFMANQNSKEMKELRILLNNNIDLQIQFIIDRMLQALPNMLKHALPMQRTHIKKQFYRIAQSPNGLYTLIDYISFKGEGINPKERYNGTGWGLLQVLEKMNGTAHGIQAVQEFTNKAQEVLINRVNNAPKTNTTDKQFLHGWLNRIQTYTQN